MDVYLHVGDFPKPKLAFALTIITKTLLGKPMFTLKIQVRL